MAEETSMLAIKWSVWDSSPLVSWSWSGGEVTVAMKMPPLSVAHLANHRMIAVVGDFRELDSNNLQIYSYEGALIRSYSAPKLGKESQFGAVRERGEVLEVMVGYRDDDVWVDMVGDLNFDDELVSKLHRGY